MAFSPNPSIIVHLQSAQAEERSSLPSSIQIKSKPNVIYRRLWGVCRRSGAVDGFGVTSASMLFPFDWAESLRAHSE